MTDTAKWDLRLLWDGDGALQALSPVPAAPAGAPCRPRTPRRAGSCQRGRNRGRGAAACYRCAPLQDRLAGAAVIERRTLARMGLVTAAVALVVVSNAQSQPATSAPAGLRARGGRKSRARLHHAGGTRGADPLPRLGPARGARAGDARRRTRAAVSADPARGPRLPAGLRQRRLAAALRHRRSQGAVPRDLELHRAGRQGGPQLARGLHRGQRGAAGAGEPQQRAAGVRRLRHPGARVPVG